MSRPFTSGGKMSRQVPLATKMGAANEALFNHLVSPCEQCRWHGEANRFGGPQIDDEFEFRRLLNRKVAGLFALENAPAIDAKLAARIGAIGTVAHQTTRYSV